MKIKIKILLSALFASVMFLAMAPVFACAENVVMGTATADDHVIGTSATAIPTTATAIPTTSTPILTTSTPILTTSTATGSMATGSASFETDSSEKAFARGTVIKVKDALVYIDRGIVDGVKNGMTMNVYRMEPITGMDGKPLDEEEVKIGLLAITEARPRISIGTMQPDGVVVERGWTVKYQPQKGAGALEKAEGGGCPEGMLYDAGGPFVYVPGSIAISVPLSQEKTEEVQAFCIDREPIIAQLTWNEAKEACRIRGARLCSKSEDQKVCATWEKPKPCLSETGGKKDCPPQNTVNGFRTELEWIIYQSEKDGYPVEDSGSCSCPGRNPVCVHCFYPDCRGAKKRFRCCREPYSDPAAYIPHTESRK